jgi:Undecaprenyl-phosphate galactose phosphotransferase WbaP
MYEPKDMGGAANPSAATVAPGRVRLRRRATRAQGTHDLPQAAGKSVSLQLTLTSAPVVIADLLALALPLALVSAVALACGAPQTNAWGWLVLAAPLVFTLVGLYPPLGLDPVREAARLGAASAAALGVLLVHDAATVALGPDRMIVLAGTWILSLPALVCLRTTVRSACARCSWWGLRAVIVGEPWLTEPVVHDLRANAQIGLRPVARLQELPPTTPQLHRRTRCHPELARQRAPFAVFALPADDAAAVQHTLRTHFASVPNLLLAGASRTGGVTAQVVNCRGLSGLLVQPWIARGTRHGLRRLQSLALTLPIALASLPLLALLVVLVKLSSPGPVFYAQERIGLHRKRIRVWKFRTMVRDADAALERYLERHPELREEWARLHKLKDDPRVTRVGRLLRKTSLDEIPQIWNVIRGDMCLVGPRPIVEAEIPKYGSTFDAYLQVPPGLTGLWQVSGRNHTSYEKRVRLDEFYVRNWSVWLDLWILVRTITVVLRRHGAH